MTWKDVRQKFLERIDGWVPRTQKPAVKGFRELEDVLQKIHPEAIDQPGVLANMNAKIYSGFRNDIKPYLSAKGLNMLQIVLRIIETGVNFDNIEKNADIMSFEKRDVTWCFCRWLAANGWKNIIPDYNPHSRIDVFAEKASRVIAAASVGSVWKFKETFTVSGKTNPRIETETGAFKARLGSALLILMEEINKNESIFPLILIPEDRSTVEIFNNYFPHVKKMGITVYKVKSKEHVTEM